MSSPVTGGPGLPQERRIVTEIPGPRPRELHARRTAAVAQGVGSVLPVYVAAAGGGVLVDVDGNSLIDLGSGIAVTSVGNLWVRSKIEPTIQMVREGKPFYSALETSAVFTDMSIDMIKVGEATGSLDDMLGSVSDFLDEQIETRMQRILSLIEPMMLIFMGIMIALILVAIYLPMFSVLGSSKFG